jgi:hypothetical protein
MKAKRLIDEAVSPETVVCYELEDGMQGSYVVGADVKAAKEMVRKHYAEMGERVSWGTVCSRARYLSYNLETDDDSELPHAKPGEMVQVEAGT